MTRIDKNQPFRVVARAPFEVYYEGEATAVSATNEVGRFDILPGHTDFFSMLTADDVIIQAPSKEVVIPVANGIVTVRNGEVNMFVNL